MLAVVRPRLGRIPRCIPLTPSTRYASSTQKDVPNLRLVKMLEWAKAEELAKETSNQYKIMSYDRAIRLLRTMDAQIESVDDLRELKGKGVGKGIAGRIEAYLSGQKYNPETKTIGEKTPFTPEDIASREIVRIKQELMTIPGVGKVAAEKLVNAGCRGLEDISKPEIMSLLQPAQVIGFKYLDQVSQPVTREEAEAVVKFIGQRGISSSWEVLLVGSYRRGSQTSSDIDIMLLHPSHVHIPTPNSTRKTQTPFASRGKSTKDDERSPLLKEIREPLEREGIIADTLTAGPYKWQGIIRIPETLPDGSYEVSFTRVDKVKRMEGEFRRADLNLVPWKSRGAAMLQLTGDTDFNIDMRTRAQHLGMQLNEYGLWRFHPRNGTPPEESDPSAEDGHWELVASEQEEDIFSELGMPFVEPRKRNFSFLVSQGDRKRRGRPKSRSSST